MTGYTADVQLQLSDSQYQPISSPGNLSFVVPSIVSLSTVDLNPNGCYNPLQCVIELGYLGLSANGDFLSNLPGELNTGVFSVLTSQNKYWENSDGTTDTSENENIDGWILFDDYSSAINFNKIVTLNTDSNWEISYKSVIIGSNDIITSGSVRFDPSVDNILLPPDIYTAFDAYVEQGRNYC